MKDVSAKLQQVLLRADETEVNAGGSAGTKASGFEEIKGYDDEYVKPFDAIIAFGTGCLFWLSPILTDHC